MIEIPWEHSGPGSWKAIIGEFEFTRSGYDGNYTYKLYHRHELIDNNSDYWGALRQYQDIKTNGGIKLGNTWYANRLSRIDRYVK